MSASHRWGNIIPSKETRLELTNTKGEEWDPAEFKRVVASSLENKKIDSSLRENKIDPDELRVKFYDMVGKRDEWEVVDDPGEINEEVGNVIDVGFENVIIFSQNKKYTPPDEEYGFEGEWIVTNKAFGVRVENDEISCYYFKYGSDFSGKNVWIISTPERVSMRTVIMHSADAIFECGFPIKQVLDSIK